MEDLNKSLIYASMTCDLKTFKRLLEKGADVNSKNNIGRTALMYASLRGHKEIVEMLLENGADINLKGIDGYTALMYASYNGHKETVEILKEYIQAKEKLEFIEGL